MNKKLSNFFHLDYFVYQFVLPFFSKFLHFESFAIDKLTFPVRSFMNGLSCFFAFSVFVGNF